MSSAEQMKCTGQRIARRMAAEVGLFQGAKPVQ